MNGKNHKCPGFDERKSVLMARRNLKMAQSSHAYVRGNTAKFYEWLETVKPESLPAGPPVWICGDCHVGNLGPVANADGHIDVQIRDLDQTVIGNPAHDLIRLGLSLATAVRSSDLPGVTTARMLEQMIEGYEEAIISDLDSADRSAHRPKAVQLVMKEAIGRRWKHLAEERIEDTKPVIPLGKRFWPLSEDERREVKRFFKEKRVRHLVTSLRIRDDDAPVELLDAAYWMKGCSSLGRLRLAVLLGVGNGDRESGLCLMDMKEAVQAVAPRHPGAAMPRDNAERVVEGARHLAPHLGERMLGGRFLDRAVFLRELLPQDLKLEFEQLTCGETLKAARYLASVVGIAHARQMDAATRRKWGGELRRNRTKTLDAPSWLWSSIVELVVGHEAAYLEHCRRYVTNSFSD